MSLISVVTHVARGLTDSDRKQFIANIYSDSDVVVSVFHQLGALEKTLISRLMLLDRSIKESLLMYWGVVPGSMTNSVRQLVDLCILHHESHDHSADRLFDMEPNFRRTINHVLSSFGVPDFSTTLVHSQKILTGAQTQKFFFQHASTPQLAGVSRWHTLLERIISPSHSVQSPADIDRVISRLGFGAYPPPPTAYRFVLSDTCSQLWTLILEFLSVIETTTHAESSSVHSVALALRLIVGVMKQIFNENCICKLATEIEHSVISRTIIFLEELDVVKRSRATSSPRTTNIVEFSIGPLASGLITSVDQKTSEKNLSNLLVGAQLIVDSNMHVTAYTQSNLQNKLIGLFCSMQRMLCGKFVIGILTRESVQRAIEAGVTSETISKFLSSNLHPKCGPSLPQNVVNQIRIWESDYPRNRIRMDPVIVLSWSLDRSEQTNRAIEQIKHKVDPYNGLVFTKIDEAGGKIHLGIKADIAREYILGS